MAHLRHVMCATLTESITSSSSKLKSAKKPEMAAYAAVVSLQHTIDGLLDSPRASSTREILESACKEASSLQQTLEGLNSRSRSRSRSRSSMERVDALEGQIRDSAHKLEDFIEFYQLKQLEEEEEEEDEEEEMRQEIRFFDEAAKRLGDEYLVELSGDNDDDGDDKDISTGSSYGIGVEEEMVGRSHLFDTVLQEVLQRMRPDDRYVWALLGEQGSGTRIVAKTFYENAGEEGKFERLGWASVGRGYELKDVLIILIAQVEADVDDELLADASDDQLSEYLYKALEDRSYLIVLDGVDDVEWLNYLCSKSLPDQGNGSVILVTTNSTEVFRSSNIGSNFVLTDSFEEEIWLAIHHAILRWEPIHAQLKVAGKEIVRNTRLLHVSIAKTLVYLSKSDKTVEQWSKIAADKDNPIFTVVDEISEVPLVFYYT